MWWAALSTDIKKSSVNWATIPKWMQKAVYYHNDVLNKIMEEEPPNGLTVQLLPNSPEGDAFTWVFTHKDEQELRQYVIMKARDMQYILYQLRKSGTLKLNDCNIIEKEVEKEYENDTDKQKATDIINQKDWYGGIYVRIGIAFSEKEPLSYEFKRYGKTINTKYTSYRGSVITLSEEAEKVAGFDLVPNYDEDEKKTILVAEVTECYRKGNEIKFRKINKVQRKVDADCKLTETVTTERRRSTVVFDQKRADIAISTGVDADEQVKIVDEIEKKFGITPEFKWDDGRLYNLWTDKIIKLPLPTIETIKNTTIETTGFIIFIHYKNALKESMMKDAPYMKRYIQDEYREIHETANKVLDRWKTNRKGKYSGGLIKQKRDDASMYAYTLNPDIKARKEEVRSLYKYMTVLLASLPKGSTIGICYGKENQIAIQRKKARSTYPYEFYDYFGDSVNLAARMVMINWQYDTLYGKTLPNDIHNRLAFTTKDDSVKKMLLEYLNSEDNTIPYMKEIVPLGSLNAGKGDKVVCISSKITSKSPFNTGDTVNFNSKKFTVIDDLGDKVDLERDGRTTTFDKWVLKL